MGACRRYAALVKRSRTAPFGHCRHNAKNAHCRGGSSQAWAGIRRFGAAPEPESLLLLVLLLQKRG